ncbi:hypothetical protein Tco_1334371 [Tanacetum coccineum]
MVYSFIHSFIYPFDHSFPASPNYTPASPDYSPASDMKFDPSEDPSSDHIPPLPATLLILSSIDDSSDSDIPDMPPSPTHGTPFTETTLSTKSSHVASGALCRRVMVLVPGQPIPHGRPYRYYPNGPIHMITVRKRVGPLPTHRLAVRHSVDYSSSDHFSLDDSSRDSSSSSSSDTYSDSSADALSDSASSRSSSGHSLPVPSSGMRPSHHLCSLRSRSPAASIPLSLPTLRALSYTRADILPSPKRIMSSKSTTDLEAEINECIAYADALRDKRIDAIVIVEAIDREEIQTGARGPVKVTYETLGDLVQRFHDHTEEIPLRRVQVIESRGSDSWSGRLRDMMDVTSQRVARSQRRELRVQREMRQVQHFRFYDCMRIARIMSNTRSGASRTREGINEQIDRQMA